MVNDTKNPPKDVKYDVLKNTEEPSTSHAATEIQGQKTL
jgi:hypothetical protein